MSSSAPSGVPAPQQLTMTHWLILIIASIGFAFDIYELLMLPLILPTALAELLPHPPGSPEFNMWRALMFWVPAMGGGLFGLLGGYLTDFLGRRRVLTWSILLYAVSAFLAGFSTSMPMLLFLRTTTFIGVCIEFVAAVAWLAELFPNPEQRERALGYTQAFSSIGGLLVTVAWLLAVRWQVYLFPITMPGFLEPVFGTITGSHAPWRYTLMSGIIPALPLLIIRPFLPESPAWQKKKEAGTLRRPSFAELFSPELRRTTIVTTLMVGLSYGAAFGAIQQIPQIVPGLPEVRANVQTVLEQEKSKEQIEKAAVLARQSAEPKLRADLKDPDKVEIELASVEKKARKAEQGKLAKPVESVTAGHLQLSQEIGGLIGRFLLALLIVRILSKQRVIRLFQFPGLFVVPVVFAIFTVQNVVLFPIGTWQISLLHVGIFIVGILTVAQFSFWGNYLPLVFPLHLRGTGESMAHNVGGRMLGTSFAAVTSLLSAYAPGEVGPTGDPTRIAYTAAAVGFFVFFMGFVLSYFLPEPKEETMHE